MREAEEGEVRRNKRIKGRGRGKGREREEGEGKRIVNRG